MPLYLLSGVMFPLNSVVFPGQLNPTGMCLFASKFETYCVALVAGGFVTVLGTSITNALRMHSRYCSYVHLRIFVAINRPANCDVEDDEAADR